MVFLLLLEKKIFSIFNPLMQYNIHTYTYHRNRHKLSEATGKQIEKLIFQLPFAFSGSFLLPVIHQNLPTHLY